MQTICFDSKKLRLATRWIIYQGLKVTLKNLKNASILSTEQLEQILKQRGININ
jgi:hypothetical protein